MARTTKKTEKEEKKPVTPVAPTVVVPAVPPTFVDKAVTEEEDMELGPETVEELEPGAKEKYFEAVGRRKEAIARVRLMTRKSGDEIREDAALMTVNGKDYLDYFKDKFLVNRVESPLRRLKSLHRFKVTAKVVSGGISGPVEDLRWCGTSLYGAGFGGAIFNYGVEYVAKHPDVTKELSITQPIMTI